MRNEEHALFTYMYMYYINKSNGHLRLNVVIHIIDQELRLLMNYTVTGKGWVFFRVILGHHYLRQAKTMEATSK